jgi:glycosyltransferase involved in cell wall biosynthesis
MKYSVCIINWNWLEVLKPSIQKLKEEKKMVDLEIIVLDNGSIDGSSEWLKQQTDITSICLSDNMGSCIGRNKMLDVAQGDYILLLDSDILYVNGSLEYLKGKFDDCDDATMCVGWNPFYFTNELDKYVDALPDLTSPMQQHVLGDCNSTFALTQYGLFKKEVFDKCRFDENLLIGWGFEDNDLYRQMQQYSWEVRNINCLYYHAKHTTKWFESHKDLHSVNYYDRGEYFKQKWGCIQ